MTSKPYSVAEIRHIEQYCYRTLGLTENELMARAGKQAFVVLQTQFPAAQTICVLAGPGNNGGDGYILAQLALQSGISVQLISATANTPATEVAQDAQRQYLQAGGLIQSWQGTIADCDLLVDALFGIGLQRPIGGIFAAIIQTANRHPAPILALDCPSGLDADSGATLGATIAAQATATFIAYKSGLLLPAAQSLVGKLSLCNLDLGSTIFDNALDK